MMSNTHREAGEFYRGLLLLIGKDRRIADEEKDLLMRIGKVFGFAPTFCATVINEIIDNTFVSEIPPLFSSKEIARIFIVNGLTVSYCDHEIHTNELEWLRSIAQINGLDDEWVMTEKDKLVKSGNEKIEDFDDMVRVFSRETGLSGRIP